MVRAGIFNELNIALENPNDIAGDLNLSWSLVKEHGAKEFQRMLSRLVLHNKDSKAKEAKVYWWKRCKIRIPVISLVCFSGSQTATMKM
jgi:hypothetical protein